MSNEIHHKTYEEMYYDSERLNMEAREKLFHQEQRITHLESVIKDMSEALGFYDETEEDDAGKLARETLSKHKELLYQITAQSEKGRG